MAERERERGKYLYFLATPDSDLTKNNSHNNYNKNNNNDDGSNHHHHKNNNNNIDDANNKSNKKVFEALSQVVLNYPVMFKLVFLAGCIPCDWIIHDVVNQPIRHKPPPIVLNTTVPTILVF